nr:hypothetical protein [Brachyspira alvinipulli]
MNASKNTKIVNITKDDWYKKEAAFNDFMQPLTCSFVTYYSIIIT